MDKTGAVPESEIVYIGEDKGRLTLLCHRK